MLNTNFFSSWINKIFNNIYLINKLILIIWIRVIIIRLTKFIFSISLIIFTIWLVVFLREDSYEKIIKFHMDWKIVNLPFFLRRLSKTSVGKLSEVPSSSKPIILKHKLSFNLFLNNFLSLSITCHVQYPQQNIK